MKIRVVHRRLLALLLLLLVLFSFTPSSFLHRWLADHEDHEVVCDHSGHHESACIYDDPPDCGVDQTVVHVPAELMLPCEQILPVFAFYQKKNQLSTLSFGFIGFYKAHRGPPVG